MVVRCSVDLKTLFSGNGLVSPEGYAVVDIFRDSGDYKRGTVTVEFSNEPPVERHEADLLLERSPDGALVAQFMNVRRRERR